METGKMFIGGEWVASSSGETREVINPYDASVICHVAEDTVEDAEHAIAAAKKAFYEDGWGDTPAYERAALLRSFADEMEANVEKLAKAETLNTGKALIESEYDVYDSANILRYYAGIVTQPTGQTYDLNDPAVHAMTVREPLGVCALIVAWNFPISLAIWKLAPALAAGNAIILKPSEITPLSAILMTEMMEKVGFPKGVVNLVMGAGATVGNTLASSLDVDKVAFTGGIVTGRKIMCAASSNVKGISLELGGKSPNIIFADADLEGAVEWAMIGIFFNQGEVCSAGSRILIEESFKETFLRRLVERTNAITLGNPLNNPDMGPMVSESQMNDVLGFIRKGVEEGATLVCGGARYTEGECAKGYFVQPTIFDNCTSEMTIVREEIFGPVVTIQTFRTEEEAVALANDTIYGLAGGVFTADGARALRVIKEIRAGITWVNCYNPTFNEAPWGGYKMSGIGRELGVHGLEEYQEVKQININLNPGPVGWYEH